jgi:hypothetical protein
MRSLKSWLLVPVMLVVTYVPWPGLVFLLADSVPGRRRRGMLGASVRTRARVSVRTAVMQVALGSAEGRGGAILVYI